MTVTYGPHIVQYEQDYSLCAGCTTCEIVCALTHDEVTGPQYNRIFLKRNEPSMIHEVLACQHCSDHPCFDACQDGAMHLDANGMVLIDEAACTGCARCIKACAFEPPRINLVRSRDKALRAAKKCDMCTGRAEGPACVQWCPVRCIGIYGQPRPVYENVQASFLGAPASADENGSLGSETATITCAPVPVGVTLPKEGV
jgi:Fe-S-cluster-containing hydrogenase component 2